MPKLTLKNTFICTSSPALGSYCTEGLTGNAWLLSEETNYEKLTRHERSDSNPLYYYLTISKVK